MLNSFDYNLKSFYQSKFLFDLPLVFSLSVMAALIVSRFPILPPAFQGAVALYPIFFVLFFLGGYWGEVRQYYELQGISLSIALSSLVALIPQKTENNDISSSIVMIFCHLALAFVTLECLAMLFFGAI